MSIFFMDKFEKRATEKFKADMIKFNHDEERVEEYELTKEEIDNLYLFFNASNCTTFADFFESFTFVYVDNLEDLFDIPYLMHDNLDYDEILETFKYDFKEVKGFMVLSRNDLYAIKGEWSL